MLSPHVDEWMGFGRRGLVALLLLLALSARRPERAPDLAAVFVRNYSGRDQKQQQEDGGPRRQTCSGGTGVQTHRCVIPRDARAVASHDLQISSTIKYNYFIWNLF